MSQLSDSIKERLLSMLKESHYKPGDMLPSESALAEEFGVSRTVVREALSALKSMGLIRLGRGHPPIVVQPSFHSMFSYLTEIFEQQVSQKVGILHFEQIRIMFEAWLAAFAAKNGSQEHIAALEKIVEESQLSFDDDALFFQKDVHFHKVLAGIPDNPVILGIHKILVEWVVLSRCDKREIGERNRETYREHRAILDKIREGDCLGGYKIMERHIYRATKDHRSTGKELKFNLFEEL